MSAVFSVGKSGIAQLLLGLDNILDIPLFDSLELGCRSLSLLERCLDLQKLLGPEERAKVLGTEGRVTMKLSHGEYTEVLLNVAVATRTMCLTETRNTRNNKHEDVWRNGKSSHPLISVTES